MATYVNDLRLKEIATGDEAGTWGTSTNTNLELIAEAFSFGTEAITTNANNHDSRRIHRSWSIYLFKIHRSARLRLYDYDRTQHHIETLVNRKRNDR
jgi:hypothetical protein